MRHLLLGWVLLAVSGCCCDLKKESYAAVPLTLDDAKKQAKESGAEISIERRTKHMGGGSCHSAVCVMLLPIIVYDAVFPDTWDEVTVSKGDEVLLVASYEKNGSLIHAQHLKDGVVLETRSIELKALGKKVYVDSAKLIDGKRITLPLSSQHDFIADERAALKGVDKPERRAEYIAEAALLLESEGLAFATERLSAKDEVDLTRAEVVRAICDKRHEEMSALLDTARANAGAWTRQRLIGCEEIGTPERAKAVIAAANAGCQGDAPIEMLKDFEWHSLPELPSDVTLTCPAGSHRALFQLWLKRPVETGDLDALITKEDELKLAVRWLDPKQENQRTAMVKLISTDSPSSSDLLRALEKSWPVLDGEMLELLAQRYTRRYGLFEISDRGPTLKLFASAAAEPDGKARTAKARAVVTAAIAQQKDAQRKAMLAAVLVVLGDTSRIAAASAGLRSPVTKDDSPSLDEDVVAWALLRKGCTTEQLEAAAKAKKTISSCD
ncbi:MAG: hypothetical protein QM817_09935 [Archangium sp.]